MHASALPPCTYEDGSAPDQVLPCHWDATTSGNGIGLSYTLTEPGGVPTYDATPEPTPEPVAQVLTTEPTDTTALTLTPAAPPAELAHTGPTDPILWVTAALLITIGACLAPVGSRRRKS